MLWRQPYRLSNFDLVTASFTLMAGKASVPARSISYKRCTPVVVSSLTPRMPASTFVQRPGFFACSARSRSRITPHSSGSLSLSKPGITPLFSYSVPLCTSSVASPPSSSSRFGPVPSLHISACSVHHQYSSSVSPFHANTGVPFGDSTVPCGPTATAAAA